jgi:hypothetical protein
MSKFYKQDNKRIAEYTYTLDYEASLRNRDRYHRRMKFMWLGFAFVLGVMIISIVLW